MSLEQEAVNAYKLVLQQEVDESSNDLKALDNMIRDGVDGYDGPNRNSLIEAALLHYRSVKVRTISANNAKIEECDFWLNLAQPKKES